MYHTTLVNMSVVKDRSETPETGFCNDSTHSCESEELQARKSTDNSDAQTRDNPKSVSLAQQKTKWKESLRKECLNRAKVARLKRMNDLRDGRQHSPQLHNRSSLKNDHVNGQYHGGKSLPTKRRRTGDVICGIEDDVADNDEVLQNGSSSSSSSFDGNLCSKYPPLENRSSVIEGMNGLHKAKLLQQCESISSANSEENVVQTAKALVEQELQRALIGLKKARQMTQQRRGDEKKLPLLECLGYCHDGDGVWKSGENSEDDGSSEEYKISHEEFLQLLEDVTEELQREDEMLEAELWEMERAEALERERLSLMIDDYEVWEEQLQLQQRQQQNRGSSVDDDCDGHASNNFSRYSSTVTNASTTTNPPTLSCPICLTGSLVETPFDGIQCTNNIMSEPSIPQLYFPPSSGHHEIQQCSFKLDVAHDGLTLSHLQDELYMKYEEHSSVCERGVLKFQIENADGGITGYGNTMLKAKCDVCGMDAVVL